MNGIVFNEQIKQEIVSRLTSNFKVKDIILFGSYAWGTPHEDSDIDLVVVLDEQGMAQSYKEYCDRRINVSRTIIDIRSKIPMDLLVYSKDEWSKLVDVDSYFIREINNNGVRLV
ncbi:MAG: nucleotidyltransferase domain-containing protein [Ignavibacteria bacterium]|nr:nucleotidyltransferase domain-containing protein [Ignavibacteria bacterium]